MSSEAEPVSIPATSVPEASDAVAPTATESTKPVINPADAKKQVFAGNLAFTTTEEDIRTLFQEAGTIANVQIITRGSRSLGYCFITYEDEAAAEKAVSTLNKRVVAGREINVEGAKPQEELAAAKEARIAQRKEKAAARKAAAAEKAAANGQEKPKKAKAPRGARKPRADDGEELDKEEGAAADGEAAGANGEASSSAPKKKRNKKSTKAKKAAVANGEEPAPADAAAAAAGEGTAKPVKAPRKPRAPAGPKGPPSGEPSKTLLFAANLSYDVDDDSLKAAFEGLSVTSSKVVKRKYGAKRSKGFGFVDFATEADQKKALEEWNGREVQGRPLSLRIAIQGSQEQAEKEAKDEAAVADNTEAPSAAAA